MKVTQYNSYKEYSEAKSKIKDKKYLKNEEFYLKNEGFSLKNEGFWGEKRSYKEQPYFYANVDYEKLFKDMYKKEPQNSAVGFTQAIENASEVQNYEGLTEEEIIRIFDNLNSNSNE